MRARYLEELNQDMLNTHGTEVFKTDYMNCSLYLYHFMTVLCADVQTRENKTFYYRFAYHHEDKDEH